jgi:acetyl esterase/lipase
MFWKNFDRLPKTKRSRENEKETRGNGRTVGLSNCAKCGIPTWARWLQSATASAVWPFWKWRATDRTILLVLSASTACWRCTTPLKPNTYKGKILVLHGVDDPVVPDDQTMAFWKKMRVAKANWEFVAYGNALHTFTNWLMPEDGPPPAVYNKQADRRSWIAMQDFFKEIFA